MKYIDNSRGARSQWEFAYLPCEVLQGANQKLNHHQSRKEHWANEYKATEDKIKEKGFQISDSSTSTVAGSVKLIVDRELGDYLSQCREKINEHDSRIKEFQIWCRSLEGKVKREPDSVMNLKHDDIEFFGL